MEATMLLCDFAEEQNGKLYIMGAGWNRLIHGVPAPIAVAVLVSIPWGATNQAHSIQLELLDEDGHAVQPEGAPGPLVVQGKLEVGRPPGIRVGVAQNAPFALRLLGLPVPPGAYRFDFSVDGTLLASAPFEVVSQEG